MKVIKKGIIAVTLLGSLTLFTGCSSVKETWDLLWGHTSDTEETGSADEVEIYDPDAVQVDSSVEAPKFTTNLKGKATYAVGDEAKALKVKAEVEGEGKISYQWYKNTVDSNGGGMVIDGATESSYQPDTSEEGHWYYFVVATNTVGKSVNMTTSGMYHIYVDPDAEPAPKEGELKKGWTEDKNGWYYVGKNGKKVTSDWAEVDGKWYLFDKKGYMRTGWAEVKNVWYYLNEDGSMATGWITVDGKKYFLEDSGAMHTGWLDSDGSMYYSASDGAIKISEWEEIDGSWYYFNEDGIMLSNCEVDGKWLNPDGRLAE